MEECQGGCAPLLGPAGLGSLAPPQDACLLEGGEQGGGLAPVTPRPTPRVGPVTPGSSLGSLDWPHRPTLVFSTHFVLTRAHPGRTSRSVTHPQIAPSQARLISEFFSNELPEKKLQLVDMSILLMSTHVSILVDSVGPPRAEVCRTAASFP